jgi:hypothetical protein
VFSLSYWVFPVLEKPSPVMSSYAHEERLSNFRCDKNNPNLFILIIFYSYRGGCEEQVDFCPSAGFIGGSVCTGSVC